MTSKRGGPTLLRVLAGGTAALLVVGLSFWLLDSTRAARELLADGSAPLPGPAFDARANSSGPLPAEPERRKVAGLLFTWPRSLREGASRWVDAGEPIARAAARVLESEVAPSRSVEFVATIVGIDATGLVDEETVSIDVEGRPAWEVARTLAHELAHGAQMDLSRAAFLSRRDLMAGFVEGSADWVAYEVLLGVDVAYLDAGERDQLRHARSTSRLVAAAMVERHAIDLDTLFDGRALRERFASLAAYGLGELLAESATRACGRRAVGGLFRACLVAGEAASGWDDASVVFESIGCDPLAVEREWEILVTGILASGRTEVDAIPRLSAAVVEDDSGARFVEVTFDRPVPADARIGVSVRRDSNEIEIGAGYAPPGGSPCRALFPLPPGSPEPDPTSSRQVDTVVLLTLDRPHLDATYSEPWVRAPVSGRPHDGCDWESGDVPSRTVP